MHSPSAVISFRTLILILIPPSSPSSLESEIKVLSALSLHFFLQKRNCQASKRCCEVCRVTLRVPGDLSGDHGSRIRCQFQGRILTYQISFLHQVQFIHHQAGRRITGLTNRNKMYGVLSILENGNQFYSCDGHVNPLAQTRQT